MSVAPRGALEEPARTLPGPRVRVDWARLAVPAATLALVGLALDLLGQLLGMREVVRDDFLLRNVLPAAVRGQLLLSMLLGAVLPVVAIAVAGALRGARVVPSIERLANVLAPLIPAALLPALFSVRFGHQSQLVYLLVLALFVVAFEPLARGSLTALSGVSWPRALTAVAARGRALPRPSSRVFFFSLVVVAAAAYTAYFAFFTIINHRRLGTTAFDLGIYDNLMFNSMHGHLFESPVLFGKAGGNYLAGHAEFAMILFVPFYAIRPGPETMLIIQAAVLGFSAVPLYLFASTRLTRPTAAVLALAYLMFAPLHGPNFYDFHWLPMAVFFQFWLYWAIATHRTWLVVIMVTILFGVREDIAVGTTVLGLFLLFTGVRPRMGVILVVLSTVWFAIVRFVIMPLAGAWYFQNLYAELFADGVGTFGSVIKTVATNPLFFVKTLAEEQKVIYTLHLFVPLAFLPARRLPLLLLALPGVVFTIMTTRYAPTISISFQYTTHWIPYLFLAAVLGLALVSQRPNGAVVRRAAMLTMAIAMLAHSYQYGAVLQHETFVGGFSHIEFKMSPADHRRYAELRELLAMIPPNASVAATEQETAHVSTRRTIYPLRWPPGPVDYLLIGRSHIGDLSRSSLNAALANPGEYGLLASRADELFLFKRGHVSPETQSARWKVGVP